MRALPNDPGLSDLLSFLEDLENAAAVATTLVRGGARVDLADFDAEVGLLCAKTLDLPTSQGRRVRDGLARLRARLETLEAGLIRAGPL